MRSGRINVTHDYGLAADGVVFDPATLMVSSMAATAVGGAISAGGTLAGGSYAEQAGKMEKAGSEFRAQQLESNATQAIASGQRQAFDTNLKTKLAISSAKARAGASGVASDTGSTLENTGELAQRGEYHALMDMFNGESAATGLRNQAAGVRYSGDIAELEGEQKKKASYLAAAGTLAGTAGSMFSTYGKFGMFAGGKSAAEGFTPEAPNNPDDPLRINRYGQSPAFRPWAPKGLKGLY